MVVTSAPVSNLKGLPWPFTFSLFLGLRFISCGHHSQEKSIVFNFTKMCRNSAWSRNCYKMSIYLPCSTLSFPFSTVMGAWWQFSTSTRALMSFLKVFLAFSVGCFPCLMFFVKLFLRFQKANNCYSFTMGCCFFISSCCLILITAFSSVKSLSSCSQPMVSYAYHQPVLDHFILQWAMLTLLCQFINCRKKPSADSSASWHCLLQWALSNMMYLKTSY